MVELPFSVWEYKEHTKKKHEVFADYFNIWVKILGKSHKLNYIDCFGGIGAYKDEKGKYHCGSPILAAEIIIKNTINLKRDVRMVIIDDDKQNIENIKAIIKYKNLDIEPIFINNDFDVAVNKILDETPNIAPTFFFIDPFGFRIKMSTLERIMKTPKSEILLNFMYFAISRFLSLETIEQTKNDLFGGEEWKSIENLEGNNREEALMSLYRSKLKKFSTFVYCFPLSFPDKDRTIYYLVHLTNNVKGCIMKDCFAKYNHGRTEYKGKMQSQLTLFDIEDVKIEVIKKFLLDKYHNTTKKYIDIIKDNIYETDFLDKEIKHALRELKQAGRIKIKFYPELDKKGKIRESIKEDDVIVFS